MKSDLKIFPISGESQSYYHGNGSENVNSCKCLETNTCNQAFGINFNCNCNRYVNNMYFR